MIKDLKMCSCRLIKGIPLAFDESMSYQEEVSALLSKLNETINQVNKNTAWIDNYEGDISYLQKQINAINSNIDTLTSILNNKASKSEVESAISSVENELKELIRENYDTLKDYSDTRDDFLQTEIDNIAIDNIKVYNVTNGLLEPLQKVLNDIYDQTRSNAISCTEFDSIVDLTCTSYDAMEISAFNFDQYGKTLLIG